MIKKMLFKKEAVQALERGAAKLELAVGGTIGPSGTNVVLGSQGRVTKDGVSVAREVEIEDPFENIGVCFVREAAEKTVDEAGDGTTTSIVLAANMVKSGLATLESSAFNPILMKRGMDEACARIVKYIKETAVDVKGDEDLLNIAMISTNGDQQMAEAIALAFKEVGENGAVLREPTLENTVKCEIIPGTIIHRGYTTPQYINDRDNQRVFLENPFIVLVEEELSLMDEILPFIEKYITTHKNHPILFVVENLIGDAEQLIVKNIVDKKMVAGVIRLPANPTFARPMLEDLAAITSAKYLSSEGGDKLKNAELDILGRAESVIITKDYTMILNGTPKKAKIEELSSRLINRIRDKHNPLNNAEREFYKARLGRLKGKVARIFIGANSPVELKERHDRVDDALNAVRSAMKEGIIPGGGTMYIKAAKQNNAFHNLHEDPSFQAGIELVYESILKPLCRIAENAGYVAADIMTNLYAAPHTEENKNHGFNAATGKYVDMVKAGIIDPAMVARVALENATSVAGMILTTECVIVDDPKFVPTATQERRPR